MTVLYVDTEHDRVRNHPETGSTHRARVEQARQRMEAASGRTCVVQPFPAISPARIAEWNPAAIVLGGNATDWGQFPDAELAGLVETIRAAPVPILGICAGHQLIGRAHGAAWGSLGALGPGEIDPDPGFAPGQRKELGFLPVAVDRERPLFADLPATPEFYQNHYWQLLDVPEGFAGRASSPWSPVQAIERIDRPVYGVQFHPERYDDAHSAGAAVLRNFFALT